MPRNALEHLRRIHDEHPAIQAEYEALAPRYAAIRALIKARQAQQVSQSELARRMGVTQPVIARLESGERSPRLDTLAAAARALGCELEVAFRPLATDAR
ncbi:MAG: helix-turn-helix transcriptional regulator [Dehalococcoidia bacterium]|nr:helix-turn-helix transcriptional regulator [Dehalococcoidia bacterium]